MAQTDPSIVSHLRKAILNICPYVRGCRNFSDMIEKGFIPLVPAGLPRVGGELLKIIANVLDQFYFYSANNCFDSEPPFQLRNVILSGSNSEGIHKFHWKTKVGSDQDYLLILKNIKVTVDYQKRGNLSFKENSPFVYLYLTDEDLIETWAEFLETSKSNESHFEKNSILSSMKLKERLRYNIHDPSRSNENVKNVDDGPSIEVITFHPPGNRETTSHPPLHFPIEEVDLVLAIECEGWPLCAQEWPSRLRRWPAQDIVDNIMREGFHIVCKSSSEGNFRLSFSNAETILIENLSYLQHKTYRAFKSFIGHYKNKWSPNIKKNFDSYHLKTIVLWYCEKSDPKDRNEDTVVCHLLSFIDELIMALKKQSLPMYFMPKYNLMEKMEDGAEAAEKLEELRFNVQLISNAISSEESYFVDQLSLLLSYVSYFVPECGPVFQHVFEKRKFELNDSMRIAGSLMEKFQQEMKSKRKSKK